MMAPEVQWEVIILSMRKARWEPDTLGDAIEDMRVAWMQGEDRELLMRAATNYGQISGFTGKIMATTRDAIEHEKTLLGEQPVQAPIAASVVAVETLALSSEINSVAWREAVAQRRDMLGAAKEEMTAQIKTLRDNYAELEAQWNDYVAASRESARKSK